MICQSGGECLQSTLPFLKAHTGLSFYSEYSVPSLQSDSVMRVTSLPLSPPAARYEGKDGRDSVRRSVQRSRASSPVNGCISLDVYYCVVFLVNYFFPF